MSRLRWGILGAAGIAGKNWGAIYHSGNGVLSGVAARDAARAEQFVRDGQEQAAFDPEPAVYGSYAELLASPGVDAVYIPLPTGLRKEWVMRAAEAGKHVLCEKPCAVSAVDLREMLAVCAANRVQFMDGVMYMHNPRQAAVGALLDDPRRIGPVRRIMSMFTFTGNAGFGANIRVQRALEPAGCLGDLGWYCIRYSLFAVNWALPELATGRILAFAEDGVTPMAFSGELIFGDGVSAGFYCSFTAASQQWVSISGPIGTVRVADFVHPKNSYEPGYEVNGTGHRVRAELGTVVPLDAGVLGRIGHPTAQDTRMFRAFAGQVQSGGLDGHWPEVALKTQLVMDACLASARSDARPVIVKEA